jgi:hypothetical protein
VVSDLAAQMVDELRTGRGEVGGQGAFLQLWLDSSSILLPWLYGLSFPPSRE